MPWFKPSFDANQERRNMALGLLQSLEPYLPNQVRPALAGLQAGVHPNQVLAEFGYNLANMLSELHSRHTDLVNRAQSNEWHINRLRQDNERLRNEPLRQQLEQAQDETQSLAVALSSAEIDLETTRRALAAEQSAHRREVAELQAYIVSQNRIIAQQQLRLNGLLGETPGAETPGEKP